MKIGECHSCEGWIYWVEPLVYYRGNKYCIVCFEEVKNGKSKE